jgi:hypothetical protein
MKRKYSSNLGRSLAIMAVMLLSTSCLDYTVKTSVNKDGSIFRQYSVRGDSTDVFDGSLKIPAGDPWHIEHFYDNKDKEDTTSEKSQYVYQASRTFRNAGELNDWLRDDTLAETVNVKVDLKKKFRWFYSYYEYREVFPMSFPFRSIPVDSFLTPLEQSFIIDNGKTVYSPDSGKIIWKRDTTTYLYSRDDSTKMKTISDACEVKMLRWMSASFVETFLRLLESEFPGHPATKEIRQKSGELTEIILRKAPFMSIDTLYLQLLVSTGDSLINSGALEEIYTTNQEAFIPMNNEIKQLDFLGNDDDYHQSLTMPGSVFMTNANEIQGELMKWDISPDYFLMKDYTMMASSRVSHPWIMGLTAIVAVFLGMILFKRSNRN